MFLKFFKPIIPSFRNKKRVVSFLSNLNINIKLNKNFFKQRLYNKHKFLTKTNKIYLLDIFKSMYSSLLCFN